MVDIGDGVVYRDYIEILGNLQLPFKIWNDIVLYRIKGHKYLH